MTDNNEIILHLSLIEGVGPSTIHDIVTHKPWDIDLQDLYQMSVSDLMRLLHLTLTKAELVFQGLADQAMLQHELDIIQMHAVNWMTVFHQEYPELLKHINAPPTIIYWQGAAPHVCDKNIAVIGSRKINYYGISAIETFVPQLVALGWTIVSGGAVGADAAAHKMAVDTGGRTIAVLGSGLLNPYPKSNARLFAEIIDSGGTLLSPFPVTMAAMAGNFPARNRIIAGLSRGCLVVQASRQSGTRITAQYALEQGRELFAIPGSIEDELSAGCHALIQEGAKLVTSVKDILDEFGIETGNKLQSENINKQMSIISFDKKPTAVLGFKADGPEAIILRCCSKPCSLDDLAESTGLLMSDLYARLFELELAGTITQLTNGMWQRC
jgi:DNA processing protein